MSWLQTSFSQKQRPGIRYHDLQEVKKIRDCDSLWILFKGWHVVSIKFFLKCWLPRILDETLESISIFFNLIPQTNACRKLFNSNPLATKSKWNTLKVSCRIHWELLRERNQFVESLANSLQIFQGEWIKVFQYLIRQRILLLLTININPPLDTLMTICSGKSRKYKSMKLLDATL